MGRTGTGLAHVSGMTNLQIHHQRRPTASRFHWHNAHRLARPGLLLSTALLVVACDAELPGPDSEGSETGFAEDDPDVDALEATGSGSGTGVDDPTGCDTAEMHADAESSATGEDSCGGSSGTVTGGTSEGSSGESGGTDGTSSGDTSSDTTSSDDTSTSDATETTDDDTVSAPIRGSFDDDGGHQTTMGDWPSQPWTWTSSDNQVDLWAAIGGEFKLADRVDFMATQSASFEFEASLSPDITTEGTQAFVLNFTGEAGDEASAVAMASFDAAGNLTGVITVPPIGPESSLEAEALLALAAEAGTTEDVDVVGLMSRVTAELAGEATQAAELTAALAAATEAEMRVLADAGAKLVDAAELSSIKATVWAEYEAALADADDTEAAIAAQVEFWAELQAELAHELGLTVHDTADASVQAWWALAAELRGTTDETAEAGACVAGQLAALIDAEMANNLATDASAEVQFALEAALDSYLTAMGSVSDLSTASAAQTALKAQLTADSEGRLGSVFEAFIATSGMLELPLRTQLQASMATIAELEAELKTALDIAMAAENAIELAIQAQSQFEAKVRQHWTAVATVTGMNQAEIELFTQLASVGRVHTDDFVR